MAPIIPSIEVPYVTLPPRAFPIAGGIKLEHCITQRSFLMVFLERPPRWPLGQIWPRGTA